MLDKDFKRNNPFWCIVLAWMPLPINPNLPLKKQFPYEPYGDSRFPSYGMFETWWDITHQYLQDINSYDHLGLNVYCYVLQFLLRNAPANTRLVRVNQKGEAIFIGLRLINFFNRMNQHQRHELTLPVTNTGLRFLQYAETLLNHPTHPLHPEDYNHFLDNLNYPVLPLVQGHAYNPYTERQVIEQINPTFFQNHRTSLSLFVLILSLLVGGGYMSM